MATRMMEEMRTIGDNFRQFIPTEEGESLDEQIFPWGMEGIRSNMQKPLPIHEGDPNTFINIFKMMAVEMQHWQEYHEYSTMVSNSELKSLLSSLARAEHVHHMKLMSLLPAMHHPAETVLTSEMSLLGAYAMSMQTEPNDTVRSAFQHIFMDHLQHGEFAEQQVEAMGCPVAKITGDADFSGGRPLDQQFIKPKDTMWGGNVTGAYNKDNVDPHTLINIDTGLAGEMAAWSGYHCAFGHTQEMEMKEKWGAFQSVEEQHLAILGSLRDPTETLLERSLIHEQVEMINYRMLMDIETDDSAKKVFADLYREDMEQARLLGQMVR